MTKESTTVITTTTTAATTTTITAIVDALREGPMGKGGRSRGLV